MIFRDPRDPLSLLCKRVKWTASDSGFFHHIPKGMVYVQGDNVNNSTDSRSFGPIPIGLIQGIVCYKVSVFAHYSAHIMFSSCTFSLILFFHSIHLLTKYPG